VGLDALRRWSFRFRHGAVPPLLAALFAVIPSPSLCQQAAPDDGTGVLWLDPGDIRSRNLKRYLHPFQALFLQPLHLIIFAPKGFHHSNR
jgi:hypothetical protein